MVSLPGESMEVCRISRDWSLAFAPWKSVRPVRSRRPSTCCCCGISGGVTPSRMFIFGIGFVGKFFANQLKNDAWLVSGTCTSVDKKNMLEELGFEAFVFGANDRDVGSLSSLQDATHLLVSIPPVAGFGDPLLSLHQEFLRSKLDKKNLKWLCYLSSTSVYGDAGGAWVNEDSPAANTSEKSKSRLAAEKGWSNLGHDLGVPAFVFRLGGIYGPGRSALDTIIKRESLSEHQKKRESRSYTSRVHVADICQALKASMNKPLSSGGIYNIVDDDPAPRTEVFAFARELMDSKWPGKTKSGNWSPATSSAVYDHTHIKDSVGSKGGEKRVSNIRMKKELGVNLIHPTYMTGLSSIAESMQKQCP